MKTSMSLYVINGRGSDSPFVVIVEETCSSTGGGEHHLPMQAIVLTVAAADDLLSMGSVESSER